MENKRYEETLEIRSYETDYKGNLKIEQAMRIMEEIGEHQMTFVGFPYDEVIRQGKTLLVNRVDTDLFAPIKKHEIVKVSSWPCTTHNFILPRRYRIESEDGKVLADMIIQWTLVDIEKKRILKPSEMDFSKFHMEELDMPLPARNKFTRDEILTKVADIVISYNEIDSNGHMNNVDYLKLVQRYIPELFEGWRVINYKVNYSKEAMYQEKVSIHRTEAILSNHKDGAYKQTKTYKFRIEKETGLLGAEIEIILGKDSEEE